MLNWMLKQRSCKVKHQKGFTLIELIVVIAILAILAALVMPRLLGFTDQARIAADQEAAAVLANAAKMYVAANNISADKTFTVSELATAKLVESGIKFDSTKYATATDDITIVYTHSTGKVAVNGSIVANNPVNKNQ